MEMSVILTMLAVLQNNEYITQEVNAKVYNLKAWSRASKALYEQLCYGPGTRRFCGTQLTQLTAYSDVYDLID